MAPAIIDTASNWSNLGKFNWILIKNIVIFIVGFIGCVLGTYVGKLLILQSEIYTIIPCHQIFWGVLARSKNMFVNWKNFVSSFYPKFLNSPFFPNFCHFGPFSRKIFQFDFFTINFPNCPSFKYWIRFWNNLSFLYFSTSWYHRKFSEWWVIRLLFFQNLTVILKCHDYWNIKTSFEQIYNECTLVLN